MLSTQVNDNLVLGYLGESVGEIPVPGQHAPLAALVLHSVKK